jgi:NitT/TauT family transport system ATP-binding protein
MSVENPMPAVPAVALSSVDKTFAAGKPSAVTALTGIDLTVAPGEFVSLIGPSGCGKSTLMRLVADLEQPSAGTIAVFGKTAHQARLDQDYGIAFQAAGLLPWRTVRANIELPLEVHGVGKVQRRARAEELLELVGLADFAGHYPAQLSGGMQQRVTIARAACSDRSLASMRAATASSIVGNTRRGRRAANVACWSSARRNCGNASSSVRVSGPSASISSSSPTRSG